MRTSSNIVVVIIFLTIIITPTSEGQETEYDVQSVKTDLELNLEQMSRFTQTIDLLSGSVDLTEVIIEVHLELANLTVFIDNQLAASMLNFNQGISTITITPIEPINNNFESTIVINGLFSGNYQKVNQNEFQFFYDWDGNYLSNNISITISSPISATISKENDEYNIFPSNIVFSSDGERIIVEWKGLSNADGLNTRVFVQFFTDTRVIAADDNMNTQILIWILSIALFIIIGAFIYLLYLYREVDNQIPIDDTEKTTKIISSVKPLILAPSEIEILKIINRFDEGIAQSELVKLLNISRARVSQNLAKFEDLGIIRKYKTGRQNIIIIDVDLDLNNFESSKDEND